MVVLANIQLLIKLMSLSSERVSLCMVITTVVRILAHP